MSDTTASSNNDLVLLLSRLAIAPLFLISAYGKLTAWPAIVNTLTTQGAPLPLFGGYVAITAEILFPVMLILGVKARWACFGLILYTLGTMVIGHRFWDFTGQQHFVQLIAFFKNLALCGGLLALAWVGPGRFALQPRP